MAVYVITGKLGSGKTLIALSRIRFYLNAGRAVATNLDIYLEKLVNPWAKNTKVQRLPDIPNEVDLNNIGLGYQGSFLGDEHNGVIVLDECAKWLNSRSWSNPDRKGLIDWMIHARKKRWDVILIIQDISAMDKQMRDLFAEHVVYCRRFDRMKIPFITSITSLFKDGGIRAFRSHVGIVKYGDNSESDIVDRWWYRGTDLFNAYDTEQGFSDDSCGLSSVLPPNYVYGRYHSKWDKFKDDFSNSKTFTFLICGLVIGVGLSAIFETNPFSVKKGTFTCNDSWEKYIGCEIKPSQLRSIINDYNKPSDLTPDSGSPAEGSEIARFLPEVYIYGSVLISGAYEYYFYNGYGNEWYPGANGFTIKSIDQCTVQLTKDDVSHIITCEPNV